MRWKSGPASGLTPTVASGLPDGGFVGEPLISPGAATSALSAGGSVRNSSLSVTPAATASGTTVICPQPGHFTFWPARFSFADSFLWHAEQVIAIMDAP